MKRRTTILTTRELLPHALLDYDWHLMSQGHGRIRRLRQYVTSEDLIDGKVLVCVVGGGKDFYICSPSRICQPTEDEYQYWTVEFRGHTRPDEAKSYPYQYHSVVLDCGHKSRVYARGPDDVERQRKWDSFACYECTKKMLAELQGDPRMPAAREKIRAVLDAGDVPWSDNVEKMFREFYEIPEGDVYRARVETWAVYLYGEEEWRQKMDEEVLRREREEEEEEEEEGD